MVKINKLEVENVKRVKAVTIEPSSAGLTIVGGNNGQGKTSVLDAIAWALGGNSYRPSTAMREGAYTPPTLKVTLSNGLVVERRGKNSDLKVTDPEGRRYGQKLLDEFVEEFALNLPKFMEANDKEKGETLLKIIGIGDKLRELEMKETEIYHARTAVGQIADQKKKYAKELPFYADALEDLVSVSDLIMEQQEILVRNGENAKKRDMMQVLKNDFAHVQYDIAQKNIEIKQLDSQIDSLVVKKAVLQKEMETLGVRLEQQGADLEIAIKTADELIDESTAELENSLANIEKINLMVRTNLDKSKAEEDAKEAERTYGEMTTRLEDVRNGKKELLNNADLPLEGLSVENGSLLYNGFAWDNMSGAEQLKVATAIVRKLTPDCGFVLLDKLEQMDLTTLNDFGAWLEQENLQAIATRVSTGEECSIIIEDGYVVDNAVENAIENAVENALSNAVDNAVVNAIENAVCNVGLKFSGGF